MARDMAPQDEGRSLPRKAVRALACARPISRTLDPTFLNRVVNDPTVRIWLGGTGEIDLTGIVTNPANICLQGEYGGFILIKHEPGIYESHSQFLPEGRGREAVRLMRDGFRYLFTRTDCIEVQTKIPQANSAAVGLARLAGFDPIFSRKGVWDGDDVVYGSLTLDRWLARDGEIASYGRWFHDRLDAGKAEAGSERPSHEDEDCHDRAVGAAMLMCRAGNTRKAVWTYNRWARLAGYQTIELISEVPPVLDVRDAVVEVRGDDMEVLLCR
jgi:hypothetical protein